MNHPKNLPQTSAGSHAVSRNISFAVLSDENLDRKIAQLNQTVESALSDHRKAEQIAVTTAWRLGQLLNEKQDRLEHGDWSPWLATTSISPRTATNYKRLADQIGSAADLKSSIRQTLRWLQAQGDAAPPVIAIAGPVEPITIEGVAEVVEAENVEADPAEVIADLESDLADAQERSSIMEEAADPKSREVFDRANNAAELIRTLKSSVANVQTKNKDLLREVKWLRRRNKALEAEAAKVVPTGGKHGA